MIGEPKPFLPRRRLDDEDFEAIMNDYFLDNQLRWSPTGLKFGKETEEEVKIERLGYSTDERQD